MKNNMGEGANPPPFVILEVSGGNMDNNEARYILGKLIGDLSRDTFITSLRSVNTDFKMNVAYRRYASTLVNLCKYPTA